MWGSIFRRSAAAAIVVVLSSCKGKPDSTPWCSDTAADPLDAGAPAKPPTYFEDVKPLIDAKCTRCHTTGGLAPFSLEKWDDVFRRLDVIRPAIVSRHMPPWHAAHCCADYYEIGRAHV